MFKKELLPNDQQNVSLDKSTLMKTKKSLRVCLILSVILVVPMLLSSQIITPAIKANFGIEGDLRSNWYNNLQVTGNDDWFNMNNTPGSGQFVIDTTGAAGILARYASDFNFRKIPFYRTMRFPAYSTIYNRLLIDAVFIRDYHGDDSTAFAAGSNKNGMSPQQWAGSISTSIPDKNEILDMMVHVRRAGPNMTDSLWMMGGLSIENTTGSRYFDFEMYQTDIYYDRSTQRFYNYGPDAGHTRWQFDAAGNVTVPGDIIFTAEYSSSALTKIEARIWVHRDVMLINSPEFDWVGDFDGDGNGSNFGYASIRPKTTGAFYTGYLSGNNTWAGPFQLVLGNNSVVTTYTARQFMEFSVNLTKLGLDPVTLLGTSACGMPFRRVLVKTRASNSFTAELKDFVGPFDFFLAPRATAAANIPVFCGPTGFSEISVTNPSPTSVYTWSTANGNIIGSNTGPMINVDQPGTYIVTQQLQAGCSTYATDTVTVMADSSCAILASGVEFNGTLVDQLAKLNWTTGDNSQIMQFELERSTDGKKFEKIGTFNSRLTGSEIAHYNASDNLLAYQGQVVYYRLKTVSTSGAALYSEVVRIYNPMPKVTTASMRILPNPVQRDLQVQFVSPSAQKVTIRIVDYAGRIIKIFNTQVQKGISNINMNGMNKWQNGMYQIQIYSANELIANEKFVVTHN